MVSGGLSEIKSVWMCFYTYPRYTHPTVAEILIWWDDESLWGDVKIGFIAFSGEANAGFSLFLSFFLNVFFVFFGFYWIGQYNSHYMLSSWLNPQNAHDSYKQNVMPALWNCLPCRSITVPFPSFLMLSFFWLVLLQAVQETPLDPDDCPHLAGLFRLIGPDIAGTVWNLLLLLSLLLVSLPKNMCNSV